MSEQSTKMRPHSLMTSQCREYGHSQAAAQLTWSHIRNFQPGINVNLLQTENAEVQPKLSAPSTSHPHQGAGVRDVDQHRTASCGTVQKSFCPQNGNPHSWTSYGLVSQADLHQHTVDNQCQFDMMNSNTTHSQRDYQRNQSVKKSCERPPFLQDGNIASCLQYQRTEKHLYETVNQERLGCISKNTTAASSLPSDWGTFTVTSASPAVQNIMRKSKNCTQQGFYCSNPPQYHRIGNSQIFRKHNFTSNLSSGEEVHHVSSMNAYTNEHSTQVNSTSMRPPPIRSTPVHPSLLQNCLSVMEVPHQSSRPKDLSITPTVFGLAGNRDVTLPEITNTVSDGKKVHKNARCPAQKKEFQQDPSKQSDKDQFSERVGSFKQQQKNCHSPPGCQCPRVVAVVQPLSQDSHMVANNTIDRRSKSTQTCEALNNFEKLCSPIAVAENRKTGYSNEASDILKEDSRIQPENQHEVRSTESLSPAHHGTVLSDSVKLELERKSGAHDKKSNQFLNIQVDHCGAQDSPQSVTSDLSKSQERDKVQREIPPHLNTSSIELSTIPTMQWTVQSLKILLQLLVDDTDDKELENFTQSNCMHKIITEYWDGNICKLVTVLKRGIFKNVIEEVKNYCQNMTLDTVIFSSVKYNFMHDLKNFNVLKDNDVYSELPYVSSWLNTNKQLDDIDKEFGFPWAFRYHLNSENKSDEGEVVDKNPSQIADDPTNYEFSQTNIESQEKQSFGISTTSTDIEEDSDNSDCTFEIHVLPPEQAKFVFEQGHMPQCTERGIPVRVPFDTVNGDLLDVRNPLKVVSETVRPIEQLSSSACFKKSYTKATTEKAEHTKVNQCAIRPDRKSPSTSEEGTKSKDGEGILNSSSTFSEVVSNKVNQIIDITDNTVNETTDIHHQRIQSGQSSIILLSKDDRSKENIPNRGPDLDGDIGQAQLKTKKMPSDSSETVTLDIAIFAKEVHSLLSFLDEGSNQEPLTSPGGAKSPLEGEEVQTQVHAVAVCQETLVCGGKRDKKRKKLRSHHARSPVPKKAVKYLAEQGAMDFSECRNIYVDICGGGPSVSGKRTAELILFGSKLKVCASDGGIRGPNSPPQTKSAETKFKSHTAGAVSVNVTPVRKKSKRNIKQIQERMSPKVCKKQMKVQENDRGLRKMVNKDLSPASNKLPSSRKWNDRDIQPRRKKSSGSSGLKLGALDQATSKQVKDKNFTEIISPLKFKVLPDTFSFRGGYRDKKESAKKKNKSEPEFKDTGEKIRIKDTWRHNLPKNYLPRHPPSTPKSSTLFKEYKKKYQEKTHPA